MRKLVTKKSVTMCCFFALLFLLGSCVSFTPSYISYEDDVHEDGMGYIYGRFSTLPMTEGGVSILYNAPVSEYLEDYYFGYPKFSLVIGDNAFFYGLEADEMVQMMAVRPGTYSIDAIERLSYEELNLEPLDFDVVGYNNEIIVEPNTAVYIGDFSGTHGRDYDNELVWDVTNPVNNYDQTTAELREKYSLLEDSNITFTSNMN